MTIGQDIETVDAYASALDMPVPGGISSYVAFYYILSSAYPQWGALGVDASLEPWLQNGNPGMVNWGSGSLNGYISEVDYPNSTLVLGINVAEDQWNPTGMTEISENMAYDEEIVQLARFCKELVDGPVYMRIAYEFDGNWNGGYSNRIKYIETYQHIASILKANSSNIVTVWHCSTSSIDDAIESTHEDITSWYPGDEYVDMMGMSYFLGPDDIKAGVASQLELANEVLEFARARKKPVMICEAAPQGYDIGELLNKNISSVWDGVAGGNAVQKYAREIWEEWFEPYFSFIHSNNDVIRIANYIDTDWDLQAKWQAPYPEGYWGDSRVQANDSIFSMWKNELNQDFWLHGSAELNDQLNDDLRALEKVLSHAQIRVYPNPSSGKIYIEDIVEVSVVKVYDAIGRIVHQKECEGVSSVELSLDVENGLYFLMFDANGQREVRPIIIE